MNTSEASLNEFSIPEDKYKQLITNSVLLCIGVCANIAVLVSLLKTWRPNSRVQFFILCLCIADFLGFCLHLGIDVGWWATYIWTAGNVGCKICMFLMALGQIMAHYFLASFNVDNAVTICCYRSSKVARILLIVFSIVAAVCTCIPQAVIYSTHVHPYYPELIQCARFDAFKDKVSETLYVVTFNVSVFWFPLLFIILAGTIAIISWTGKRTTPDFEEAKKRAPEGSDLDTFGWDLAMVSAFNVAFILCWAPMSISLLIDRFGTISLPNDSREVVWLSLKYIYEINGCLNPLIYGIFTCLKRTNKPRSRLEPFPTSADNKAFVE
ncbi:adipokinetic hormone/corazonin-related peptide receptor variant I-like [Haliotis asinina]|uniref:adipokinetic hormone/corazonin-related peptide receptor variant I-like n=1 Tax=Haliotis asinina TaxID=109174 RepID=UPI003532592C